MVGTYYSVNKYLCTKHQKENRSYPESGGSQAVRAAGAQLPVLL